MSLSGRPGGREDGLNVAGRKKHLTVFREIFVNERKKTSIAIDTAKRQFLDEKIESAKNSKTLFNVANELLGAKQTKPLPDDCPRAQLPQIFSDFFSDKIKHIRTDLDNTETSPPSFNIYEGVPFLKFQPVSVKDIHDIVIAAPSKTCVLDPLPTDLVKGHIDILAPIITDIVNLSLSTGTVPKDLKRAVITPILKKHNLDPNTLKNYRPVSNLPFISKILEKVVLKQCQYHLRQNNLLETRQSAYRKNHSTETAVLSVMEELLSNIDERLVSLVALLDLSAAFDTIDHDILLSRLKHSFGFQGTVLKWFNSYLSDRYQSVCIDDVLSSPAPLSCGVPQGSVLGPVLFSLYTQPLSDVIISHKCSYHKYADDTQLCKSSHPDSFLSAQTSMQACIDDILTWMVSNKLKLNPEKTEAMVSGSKLQLNQISSESMTVDNNSIPFVQSVKYLGVTLDSSLTMQRHISDVCRSTFLALRRISSIRRFLSVQSTATLVHASITSRLDYCNSTLSGISSEQVARLQRVQNSAARLVLKKRKREHITPLFKQLHWLPISFRIEYKLAVFAFRYFDNSLPLYISQSLSTYQSSRTLRSSSEKLLNVPRKNLKMGYRSFSSSLPRIWNSLPSTLRDIPTLSLFKTRLKTHLYQTAFPQQP